MTAPHDDYWTTSVSASRAIIRMLGNAAADRGRVRRQSALIVGRSWSDCRSAPSASPWACHDLARLDDGILELLTRSAIVSGPVGGSRSGRCSRLGGSRG